MICISNESRTRIDPTDGSNNLVTRSSVNNLVLFSTCDKLHRFYLGKIEL
jgi:hypothetical protein